MVKSMQSIDDKMLSLFEGNMKRIFALSVTKSTFREIQNVILNLTNHDKELANALFETLLTGQIKENLGNERQKRVLEEIIKDFCIPARLAKEIHERGEFINVITSDALTQKEEIAFLNRLRRIDGDEMTFMTDPESTLHLILHFIGRMHELKKIPGGEKQLEKHKNQLTMAKERLNQLL